MVYKLACLALLFLTLFLFYNSIQCRRKNLYNTSNPELLADINTYTEEFCNFSRACLRNRSLTLHDRYTLYRQILELDSLVVGVTKIMFDSDGLSRANKIYKDVKVAMSSTRDILDSEVKKNMSYKLKEIKDQLFYLRLIKLKLQRRGIINKKYKL
uniref:Prolyl 4-hydroxylase alpha-subunit N-terminal domain-containing protein n=1 Tax=Clastoptera arizonana TaxID=38151 RepID=A0A1B6DZQ9_9HEMI